MAKKSGGKKNKSLFGKFWYLLWSDNSLKGWIFSIVFIFIFIKFIFFPGLILITGTPLPLAIVESCSMYHEDNLFTNFDSWWERHDDKYSEFIINELDFRDFTLKNGFTKGDILFVIGTDTDKLEEGDVIIFNANQQNPIIHRIVEIKEANGKKVFSTVGDNNERQLTFEKNVYEEQIIGKAVLRVAPYFGWIKLMFYEAQKPKEQRGFCDER